MSVSKVLINNKINSRILQKTIPYMQRMFEVVILNQDGENEIIKALNETKPDVLFITKDNWSNAVQAYRNINKCKVVMFADEIVNNVDFTITNNIDLLSTPNTHMDLVLADLSVMNYLDRDVEKTDVSLFINDNTDIPSYIVDFLCQNYNVKIYGNKKINSPRYLGIPNSIEKMEILNKSKVIIDLGTYDYMDAILLGCYPVVYTNTSIPEEFTSFDDLISISEAMDYVQEESNQEDIKNKLSSLYGHFLQTNNYLSALINIFNNLGYAEQTKKLFEIKGEIINDRISNR